MVRGFQLISGTGRAVISFAAFLLASLCFIGLAIAQPPRAREGNRKITIETVSTDLPERAVKRFGSPNFTHWNGTPDAVLSDDGSVCITASTNDNTVRRWNANTGEELRRLSVEPTGAARLVLSPKATNVGFVEEAGRRFSVWDVALMHELLSVTLEYDVTSVAFSSDETTAYAIGTGITGFNLQTGKVLFARRIEDRARWVRSSGRANTNLVLATATDKIIEIDAKTGETRREGKAEVELDFRRPVFSYNGALFCAADIDTDKCTFSLFDTSSGKQQQSWSIEGKGNRCVAFLADERTCVTAVGGSVVYWDTRDKKEVRKLQIEGAESVRAISGDGRRALTASKWSRSQLFMVDMTTAKALTPMPDKPGYSRLYFSRDDRKVLGVRATAMDLLDRSDGSTTCLLETNVGALGVTSALSATSGDVALAVRGRIHIWRSSHPTTIERAGTETFPRSLAFGANDELYGVYFDGTNIEVKLALSNKTTMKIPYNQLPNPQALVLAADGSLLALASTGDNVTIHIHDATSGKEVATISDLKGDRWGPPSVKALAFSSQKTVAVALDKGPILSFWEFGGGRHDCDTKNAHLVGNFVIFSPDGRYLAGAEISGDIVIWETATGAEVRRLTGHHRRVEALAFSDDSRYLASSASDCTTLIWKPFDAPHSKGETKISELAELHRAWIALASREGEAGTDALWQLVNSPDKSVPFLRKQFGAVPKLEPGGADKLVAQLDAEDFEQREQALGRLADYPLLKGNLEKAYRASSSLEQKKRLITLVRDFDGIELLDNSRRRIRAIQVLEYVGNDECSKILHDLGANGAEGAALTELARSAAARLDGKLKRPAK